MRICSICCRTPKLFAKKVINANNLAREFKTGKFARDRIGESGLSDRAGASNR
jgi:hypothetical protein